MQRIGVMTRQEFGFHGDPYPGYFLLKDREPVLQLHLYGDYYTLFWRGEADLFGLGRSLDNAANEVCQLLEIPEERLNVVSAQYTWEGRSAELVFPRRPREPEEESALRSHYDFLDRYSGSISFARYDVEGGPPVILWADLAGGKEREVGFSSSGVLPLTVLQLFRTTCFTQVSDVDLEDIGRAVRRLISQENRNYTLA